jgi:hypothetical protein
LFTEFGIGGFAASGASFFVAMCAPVNVPQLFMLVCDLNEKAL